MAMMGSDSASDSSSPSAPVDHEADKFKEWVHDEYNDPRADVELVAAGGVVFRVHSHALIKSRYVASVDRIKAGLGTSNMRSCLPSCTCEAVG
jgi:hypothetical protein